MKRGTLRNAARAKAKSGQLQFRMIGGISLSIDDQEIALSSKKAKALLAYLSFTPLHKETRERIVGLLWSETAETKARASLRQVLRILRSDLEHQNVEALQSGRSDVGFDFSRCDVDVWSVFNLGPNDDIDPLVFEIDQIADTVLVGYENIDPAFSAWLRVQRRSLHELLIKALEKRSATLVDDPLRAKLVAEALIKLDPTHEVGYQTIIKCCAENGDIAGALGAYKKLWDLLAEEYDTEPSPQTQDLIVSIKSSGSNGAAETSFSPSAGPVDLTLTTPTASLIDRTVASKPILYLGSFDLAHVSDDRHHMASGFRREVISTLVRFREWLIVDADSMTTQLSTISRGHTIYDMQFHVVETAAGLSINLTLSSMTTGLVFWGEQFLLDIERFYEMQKRIIRRIAVALNVHLSAERLQRVSRLADISLENHDRWLRSQSYLHQWRPETCTRAETIFHSIVEEHPEFAPAYCGLAEICNARHLLQPGVMRDKAREEQALNYAKKAAKLDPLDSRSQLCLAWTQMMTGQFEQADLTFRLAFDLNSNDPWTMISVALGLAYSGHVDEAVQQAAHAAELSPSPPQAHWGYQCGVHFLARDFEASIVAANHAGDTPLYVRGWKVAALVHTDSQEAAEAEINKFFDLIRSNWFGPEEPNAAAIIEWFLQAFPIRRTAVREQLRSGLTGVGGD